MDLGTGSLSPAPLRAPLSGSPHRFCSTQVSPSGFLLPPPGTLSVSEPQRRAELKWSQLLVTVQGQEETTLGRTQGQGEERAGDGLWGRFAQRWGLKGRKWMESLRERSRG